MDGAHACVPSRLAKKIAILESPKTVLGVQTRGKPASCSQALYRKLKLSESLLLLLGVLIYTHRP